MSNINAVGDSLSVGGGSFVRTQTRLMGPYSVVGNSLSLRRVDCPEFHWGNTWVKSHD